MKRQWTQLAVLISPRPCGDLLLSTCVSIQPPRQGCERHRPHPPPCRASFATCTKAGWPLQSGTCVLVAQPCGPTSEASCARARWAGGRCAALSWVDLGQGSSTRSLICVSPLPWCLLAAFSRQRDSGIPLARRLGLSCSPCFCYLFRFIFVFLL